MLKTEEVINNLTAQDIIDMTMEEATLLKHLWRREVMEGKR